MTNADNIEKKIEQINLKSTPAMRSRILADATQAMEQTINARAATPSVRRIIMNSKMAKFAVAAMIILVGMVIVNQFGGSIDGASVAFAEVLENISNTGNVVYKEISEIPGHTFNRVQMVNQDGIIRCESEDGGIFIFDFDNGLTLGLPANQKHAVRSNRKGRKKKAKGFSFIGWVRKLHDGEAIFDRQEELDGIITNVYVWQIPFEKMIVWVDPESNLPVKVEHIRLPNTEKNIVVPELSLSEGDFGGDKSISGKSSVSSGRSSGLGISEKSTRIMYDFQWDAELDESLFSLDPPEGYTLEEKYPEDSPVDDNSLVHILGFWAKMNNGEFPTEEQINDPKAFKPLIIEEYDKDGDPKEEFYLAGDEVSRVLKGIYLVQEKKVGGSWGYAGQGVVLGQSEMIICWWFDEEVESYKAIYGDLTIEDIAVEDLPE